MSTDPDLWRIVGWEDDPNHFVNFGVTEYGAYPFTALPREYGAAVEKFGLHHSEEQRHAAVARGRDVRPAAPRLRGIQRSGPRTPRATSCCSPRSPRTTSRTPINRCTRPTTTMARQTGQHGVHARFERDLFERYESRLTTTPAPPRPMTSPRDAAFDALLDSYQLVDASPRGRQGSGRPTQAVRRRLLRGVLREGQAVARAARVGGDHGDRLAHHRRVGAGREARRSAAKGPRHPESPQMTYPHHRVSGARSATIASSCIRRRRTSRSRRPLNTTARFDSGPTAPACAGTRWSKRQGTAVPTGGSRAGATASCRGWRRPLPSNAPCGRCATSRRSSCAVRRRSSRRACGRFSMRCWPMPEPPPALAHHRSGSVHRVGHPGLRAGPQSRRVLHRVQTRRPSAVVARRTSGDGEDCLDVRARPRARRTRLARRRAARDARAARGGDRRASEPARA